MPQISNQQHALLFSIGHVIESGIDHNNYMQEATHGEVNYVRGGGIVMMFSWLQHNCSDTIWQNRINIPRLFSWPGLSGWLEFINFNRIRHCFAHNGDGKLLPNHALSIKNFLEKFNHNPPLDSRSNTRKPYYSIQNDRIVLTANALHWCKVSIVKFYNNLP